MKKRKKDKEELAPGIPKLKWGIPEVIGVSTVVVVFVAEEIGARMMNRAYRYYQRTING